MKFLGKRKDPKNPLWWIGETMECQKCDSSFELEKNDEPPRKNKIPASEYPFPVFPEIIIWTIDCPECNRMLIVRSVKL